MATTSKMRLFAFLMNTPINHMSVSWSRPEDRRLSGLRSYDYWTELASVLEKGKFDGVFFADGTAVYDVYQDSTDSVVKYGVTWPVHDPMALAGVMLSSTRHLGFVSTISISSAHPYAVVRALSTHDALSNGRMGWNIVTGNLRSEYRAFGIEMLEHDLRYDRADEFMSVCHQLWSGIAPDAIIADKESIVFADPAKVTRVEHVGRYFKCSALPPILPSPMRRPVLFQAGSSGRGLTFAAQHADVAFAINPSKEGMKTYVARYADANKHHGQGKTSGVIFGVQPFIGSTEAEAVRQQEEMLEAIPLEATLSRISATIGVDLGKIDLDKPLAELHTESSQGLLNALRLSLESEGQTLRTALKKTGHGIIPQIVGTPAQIADQLEAIWRDTGCLGFNLTPPINDKTLIDFAEEVVPLLQKRGICRTAYGHDGFYENIFEEDLPA